MKYQAPFGAADPDDSYVDKNVPGAVSGSKVPAKAIEHPQRELDHLIAWAGLTPSDSDLEQVRKALAVLAAGKQNLLINGDFKINSRAFAGGALSDGVYGFDRWRSVGASSLTLSGYVLTLASGEIAQTIEPAFFGMASLASTEVVVSVENPDQDLTITVGSVSGTLPAGAGRQSVVLTTDAGDTGNINVKVKRAAAGSVSFGRVKMEIGPRATEWSARPTEAFLAARYCYAYRPGATASRIGLGMLIDTGEAFFNISLPNVMRTNAPVITQSGWVRQVSSDAALTSVISSAVHGNVLAIRFATATVSGGPYPTILKSADANSYLIVDAEF